MTATDHLGPQFLHHGTTRTFRPGDKIEVGHPSHYQSEPMDHVYAAGNKGEAMDYAVQASWHTHTNPKVYQVHPTGDMETDPESRYSWETAVRSRQPMTVGKRVVYFPPGERSTRKYLNPNNPADLMGR